ncbi:unnamed protein product [Urochloa decumbens]|uniref:Uncharacterized protein n=1 Tax=Urochloa decumbens TaxID=240449 RepID=A0ABC9C1A2_9POAL
MAEEPAWKPLARQQAVEAPGRCVRAGNLLALARPDLAPQALVSDPQACRAWAHGAEARVAEASGELAAAARAARAAHLLVLALYLYGVPGAPAPPLSADDVSGEILRDALASLVDAGDRASRACDHAAAFRGFLAGVLRLLDHPRHLPGGVDDIFDALLGVALDDLDRARTLAQETGQLVNEALQLLA